MRRHHHAVERTQGFGHARLVAEHPGQVRYVARQLPLPFHAKARLAAIAALAAGEQGKYWEMHDALLAHQDALDRAPPGATLELALGLYEGPFVLERPVTLHGAGAQTVLFGQVAEKLVVRVGAGASATFRSLTLQGGQVGVRLARGQTARFEDVTVRGQAEVGLDCVEQSRCELTRTVLQASFPRAVGLYLGPGATGTLNTVGSSGPFRRAIEADGAHLVARELRFRLLPPHP